MLVMQRKQWLVKNNTNMLISEKQGGKMANGSMEPKVYATNCSEFEENVKSRTAIVQSYTSIRARKGELPLLHALPFCCLDRKSVV